jgi:hypothetical protein
MPALLSTLYATTMPPQKMMPAFYIKEENFATARTGVKPAPAG